MRSKLTPFEQALLDASLEEFADIPEEEDAIDIPISPGFAAKARKLIRNTQRKTWRYTNTTAKRIILVAAIVALLATTAMAVPVIREAVIRFFVHDEGTHYEFTFDPETLSGAPQEIETVYMPTYIPEGYEMDSEVASRAAVHAIWFAGDCMMTYSQFPMPHSPNEASSLLVNAENVDSQLIQMGEYEVFQVEDSESIMLIWTNHAYLFTLVFDTFGDSITRDEIDRVFYSVQVTPDITIP